LQYNSLHKKKRASLTAADAFISIRKKAANIKAGAVDNLRSKKDIDLMFSEMLVDTGDRYLDILSACARQTAQLSTKALALSL
jgi:hypothetical protein